VDTSVAGVSVHGDVGDAVAVIWGHRALPPVPDANEAPITEAASPETPLVYIVNVDVHGTLLPRYERVVAPGPAT